MLRIRVTLTWQEVKRDIGMEMADERWKTLLANRFEGQICEVLYWLPVHQVFLKVYNDYGGDCGLRISLPDHHLFCLLG